MKTKVCRDCNLEKGIDKFRKNSRQCKACESIYKKKYYLKVKEHKLKYSKEYREEHSDYYKKYREKHKEKMRNVSKKYYFKNKEEILKRSIIYEKERRNRDNIYKLKKQMRNMIRCSFTRRGINKSKKTEKIVGCSLDFLYKYLLKSYKKVYGYEWDFKEPVHIDHIISLSNASNEEDIIKLCNYKNLQLLKAKDNLKKGTK